MNEPFRILFVCMGNSCRSPLAEYFMKKRLADEGKDSDVVVESAGLSAIEGDPPSEGSIFVAQKHGLVMDDFRSRSLTKEIGLQAHLIVVMEPSHQMYIDEMYPECSDKVRLLGQFNMPEGSMDIPDPVGGDESLFEEVGNLIDMGIERMIHEWSWIRQRFYEEKTLIIALGADHRGWKKKVHLMEQLREHFPMLMDCGTDSEESCDHPDFAFRVAETVALGRADRGILVCSSGHGMIISANKVPGIRAVMAYNQEHAVISRQHNNANVLTLGADFLEDSEMKNLTLEWLNTGFFGGKYQRRINLILGYESNLHA